MGTFNPLRGSFPVRQEAFSPAPGTVAAPPESFRMNRGAIHSEPGTLPPARASYSSRVMVPLPPSRFYAAAGRIFFLRRLQPANSSRKRPSEQTTAGPLGKST